MSTRQTTRAFCCVERDKSEPTEPWPALGYIESFTASRPQVIRRGPLRVRLVQISFFDSVRPPPTTPRCATALNFVIPSFVIPSVSRGTRDLRCALPSNNSLQLPPSISANAKVGRHPQICHPLPLRCADGRRTVRVTVSVTEMALWKTASRCLSFPVHPIGRTSVW